MGLFEVEAYLSRGNISYPDCTTLTTWEALFDYSSRTPRLLLSSLLKQKRLRLKIHMSGRTNEQLLQRGSKCNQCHDTNLVPPAEPLGSLPPTEKETEAQRGHVTFLRHMVGN